MKESGNKEFNHTIGEFMKSALLVLLLLEEEHTTGTQIWHQP